MKEDLEKPLMNRPSYNLFRKKKHLMGMEEKEERPEESLSCSPQEEDEERRPGREEASLIIVTRTRAGRI